MKCPNCGEEDLIQAREDNSESDYICASCDHIWDVDEKLDARRCSKEIDISAEEFVINGKEVWECLCGDKIDGRIFYCDNCNPNDALHESKDNKNVGEVIDGK